MSSRAKLFLFEALTSQTEQNDSVCSNSIDRDFYCFFITALWGLKRV